MAFILSFILILSITINSTITSNAFGSFYDLRRDLSELNHSLSESNDFPAVCTRFAHLLANHYNSVIDYKNPDKDLFVIQLDKTLEYLKKEDNRELNYVTTLEKCRNVDELKYLLPDPKYISLPKSLKLSIADIQGNTFYLSQEVLALRQELAFANSQIANLMYMAIKHSTDMEEAIKNIAETVSESRDQLKVLVK